MVFMAKKKGGGIDVNVAHKHRQQQVHSTPAPADVNEVLYWASTEFNNTSSLQSRNARF
jgi:hypothetical protein